MNDQSNGNYSVVHGIIYSTEALKPNLCEFDHSLILGRGNISSVAASVAALKNKWHSKTLHYLFSV